MTRSPYRHYLQVQARLNNWEIARKNKQGEFEMWLKTNKLSEGKKHVTRFAMAGKEK